MKILYVTTVGRTMGFFPKHFEMLESYGNTIELACNMEGRELSVAYKDKDYKVYDIPLSRNPWSKANIQGYRNLKKIVKEGEYDLVHCHTPVAAMCTRLACKAFRKKGLKVFYTAHGFHFFKGAPLKNWLLYYPVEWICSFFTDKLITINKEDYERAKKHFHANVVEYIPGVGLDIAKFSESKIDRNEKRIELGVPENAFLLTSVGELNKNKNHQVIIRAMAKLKNPDIYYVIAGRGNNMDNLKLLAKSLGLEDKVKVLGFRSDIPEILKATDLFCFPSRREGLGKASMEAMAYGLPLATSNVHGINDYSEDGITGYKTAPDDYDGFAKIIDKLYKNPALRDEMGKNCKETVKRFDAELVIERMREIYGI